MLRQLYIIKVLNMSERDSFMKRFITIMVISVLLIAAMCLTAFASNNDAVAEELSWIGMFMGTDAGFELDRAPTRAEAAIMLTRLYGAEESAAADYAAGKISHPFTDVSENASPYVAWLYTKGLTNGMGGTEYGASQLCSAQQYSVFMLRALGYKDGVDFDYNYSFEFVVTRGIFDLSFFTDEFLRDDLAAVTYQALACDMADGSTYLLASLIDSGAVDAEAAKPITNKIENYKVLSSASNAISNGVDADVAMTMSIDVDRSKLSDGEIFNGKFTATVTADGKLQMVMTDPIEMGMTMDMVVDVETGSGWETLQFSMPVSIGMWVKDNWVYVQQDDTAIKQELFDEEFFGLYQGIMTQVSDSASVAMGMPYVGEIKVETKGTDTVYTLTYNEKAYKGLLTDMLDYLSYILDDEDIAIDFDFGMEGTYATYTFDKNGQLKSESETMAIVINDDAENGVSVTVAINCTVDFTVNAVGDNVKVKYPDLSGFMDIADLY